MLLVERLEDLTESVFGYLRNDGKVQGYVLFRERSFVKCGYCGSLCAFTGVIASMEIDFTPDSV